jgi:serine/threonine protein kinase
LFSLNFGVAKLLESSTGHSQGTTRTSLTEVGVTVGTAAYMSPEQIRGDQLDARSDRFSFGVVLYEMVTGRRPFNADGNIGVIASILSDEPVAPSRHVEVPSDVERTVLRCLRKDPARRYQSMADLKVALEDLTTGSEGVQVQPSAGRVSRGWVGGLVALLPALALKWE